MSRCDHCKLWVLGGVHLCEAGVIQEPPARLLREDEPPFIFGPATVLWLDKDNEETR